VSLNLFSCQFCEREFQSKQALSGHQRIHGPSLGGFSVSRKTNRRQTAFSCLNCDIEGWFYPSTHQGKYCSNQCQMSYRWTNETLPSIISGDCNNKKALKKFLRENRGDKCEICQCPPIHNNKPLVLQLDHINGDSDDNSVANLRLLCPNCHSQTETFGSKNNRKNKLKATKRNSYLRIYQKVSR
jgi:hypothetical protein